MNFEPANKGFLDFFKKKSKQPSNGKSINYEEISQKLADMYPDDTKKEFDNRRKYLKTILNDTTDLRKKYKDTPGINFKNNIDILKCFIQEKDYEGIIDNESGWYEFYEFYEEFLFMHKLLPTSTPKEDNYTWAYKSQFTLSVFDYDIWEWVENGPYKEDFKTNKRIVRDFDDTDEWWSTLENITKDFKSKLSNSEFFYDINYVGDWDDGGYEILLKPSKYIQSLAERCSKYKAF